MGEAIREYIAAGKMEDRVVILGSDLSDDERNGLLAGADLFVSPSLFEGFGRTPVEAAMLEIPVLTTRETSLPEATMELVHYYEPARDENALAEAILSVFSSPQSPEQRREIARILREQYAPERIAGLCREHCLEMMGRRP